MDDREYSSKVVAAYEGEIAGAVLTAALLAKIELDEQECRALCLLLEIELMVATVLRPLVQRLGIDCSDPSNLAHHALARAARITCWNDLIAVFGPRLDAYVSEFETLHASARIGDEAALDLLADHERALREFGRLEAAGRSAAAIESLERLLGTGPVVVATDLSIMACILKTWPDGERILERRRNERTKEQSSGPLNPSAKEIPHGLSPI